jgi:hypothetical protein
MLFHTLNLRVGNIGVEEPAKCYCSVRHLDNNAVLQKVDVEHLVRRHHSGPSKFTSVDQRREHPTSLLTLPQDFGILYFNASVTTQALYSSR